MIFKRKSECVSNGYVEIVTKIWKLLRKSKKLFNIYSLKIHFLSVDHPLKGCYNLQESSSRGKTAKKMSLNCQLSDPFQEGGIYELVRITV